MKKEHETDLLNCYIFQNILALSSVPSAWPIPIGDEIQFPNNVIPGLSTEYSFCKVS